MSEPGASGVVQLGDCGWRNRFDSSKSSSYDKNGTHFKNIYTADVLVDGFIGVDTVTVREISSFEHFVSL